MSLEEPVETPMDDSCGFGSVVLQPSQAPAPHHSDVLFFDDSEDRYSRFYADYPGSAWVQTCDDAIAWLLAPFKVRLVCLNFIPDQTWPLIEYICENDYLLDKLKTAEFIIHTRNVEEGNLIRMFLLRKFTAVNHYPFGIDFMRGAKPCPAC